jgi:hypothetical protein
MAQLSTKASTPVIIGIVSTHLPFIACASLIKFQYRILASFVSGRMTPDPVGTPSLNVMSGFTAPEFQVVGYVEFHNHGLLDVVPLLRALFRKRRQSPVFAGAPK